MDDKELVREFMNSTDEIYEENDVFVSLMLPLANLSKVMKEGEVPSKEMIEETRKSIKFFKGFLDDVDNMLNLLEQSIQEEEP